VLQVLSPTAKGLNFCSLTTSQSLFKWVVTLQ
jgi:hypothetical protein